MTIIRKLTHEFGLDNLALGMTGIAAIVIGVLEFAEWIKLTDSELLKMLLVAVGLLMTAVVSQVYRRASETKQLRDEIGIAEIKILDADRSFPESLAVNVSKAKKFVLDTAFNFEYAPVGETYQSNYRLILEKRLKHGEISFRRVDVIYNKERFALVVRRLLKYEGLGYFIRYYKSPPKAIPLLNMMSFDDEYFYLGGYHSAESEAEEYAIYVRHPSMAQFLRGYWKVLWLSATPLNEAKRINWNELKQVAISLGMANEEYESLIKELKSEVQIDEI